MGGPHACLSSFCVHTSLGGDVTHERLRQDDVAANARGSLRHPHKSDDVTPAALFRLIDLGVTTLLLDEIDNADLAKNWTFRTIANGGHHRSGSIVRTIDGRRGASAPLPPWRLRRSAPYRCLSFGAALDLDSMERADD